MSFEKRKILVTSALPYANGALHLGHIIEKIQTDIWTRFLKMCGHEVTVVCGIDAHGTPIMLKAEQMGITPEQLITQMHASHFEDLNTFGVHHDIYYTTHSEENRALSYEIFKRLQEKGDIASRTILQAFDPVKQIFLPDRYVKGTCPFCNTPDQYGDNCESCGKTYSPLDLKNPVSALSGATPIQKESEHFFFQLSHYKTALEEWTRNGHLQDEVANKLDEWFQAGLEDWDISRDAPYFGFEIPGHPGKYFYVWLEAPIGYMSSFKKYCDMNKQVNFEEYWQPGHNTELYHFVGKDIIYFHALFWPAILMGSGFRTPTAIFAHGFLTVNGQKMSKSRGTFIEAKKYLAHAHPDYLRYYFAAKLTSHVEDIDLSVDDFMTRVNSDLVGKFVNIASRCAGFIKQHFNNQLSDADIPATLSETFLSVGDIIKTHYENREFSKAIREIIELAGIANQYIDEKKPWSLIKDPTQKQTVQDVCSIGIHLFRLLTLYLKPIIPFTAEKAEAFLNCPPLMWEDRLNVLKGHTIHDFEPLMQRLLKEKVDAMTHVEVEEKKLAEPLLPAIKYDDFAKVDLRIGKIVSAESVEGADKLLKLRVDIGGEEKQVFAGIKSGFAPEDLIGKHSIFVVNLEPRQMKFGVSEAMIIIAKDGNQFFLLEPSSGAKPGLSVK